MSRRFATLDELYLSTLREVFYDYRFRNCARGQPEREVIGYSAQLDEPAARYCLHPRRRQNVVFNYAEALWYLSGRNDLDFIRYYAPAMARYSADGLTLPGTGYGARLLHFGPADLNQIDRAIEVLRHDDPDSKRVFLQIFDASENIYRDNIDVSCTLGLQLLRRDGRLHMVAYMRANDAYVGMLSDVFSFTFLQEYIACALGCTLGTYWHHVGSLHIYDQHCQSVEALLRDEVSGGTYPAPPRIPEGLNAAVIEEVLAREAQIRAGRLTLADVRRLPLHEYWREILALFCLYRAVTLETPVDKDALEGLHPLHRRLIINRWPKVFGRLAARTEPANENDMDDTLSLTSV